MVRIVKVAATQFACSPDKETNVVKAESMIERACSQGANIVLIQELFEGPYFCITQKESNFLLANPLENNPTIKRLSALAKRLNVVIPISFFERCNCAYYNSVAVIDADGEFLGLYRKSHIPDGPGYQEKFYFNPGDTGFKVFHTKFGALSVLICWDQWFPEAARACVLQGAEMILYPTAIGSEPHDPTIDSRHHWRRVMQGHAGANLVPVVASNRIGKETSDDGVSINFYGTSFIANATGEIVADAGDSEEAVLVAEFDLDALRVKRASWGIFRDRRPQLYGPVNSLDGKLWS
eukprot:jgi/Mesvir1/5334/Mv15423-RA.1